MNAEAYNLIIETISNLLDAKQFRPVDQEDGSYFTNGTLAVRVQYDENRELFLLEQATMEGEPRGTELKTLSSTLCPAVLPP